MEQRLDPGPESGSTAKPKRALAALLLPAFCAAVYFPFRHVQLRIWNYLSWIDLAVMVALVAPFLASRWIGRPHSRATRIAWWLCALLAIDVLAFDVGLLAPSGGHPSLEALVSYFLGMAKVAIVPLALGALVVAAWRGERALTLVLGAICLATETVYTVVNSDAPLAWFALLCRRGP